MEPLRHKPVLGSGTHPVQLEPEAPFKVQRPEVAQVCVIRFAAAHKHELPEQAARMVRARTWQRRVRRQDKLLNAGARRAVVCLSGLRRYEAIAVSHIWQPELQRVVEPASLGLAAAKNINSDHDTR